MIHSLIADSLSKYVRSDMFSYLLYYLIKLLSSEAASLRFHSFSLIQMSETSHYLVYASTVHWKMI